MAEQPGQEKTEQATPKRRDEAREKGQVPRSRDLHTALILMGSAGMIVAFGGHFIDTIVDLFRSGLSVTRAELANPGLMLNAFVEALGTGLLAIMPFLVVISVVAVLAPVLMSGWVFSSDQLSFKWSRLDPLKGLAKMFSYRGVVELFKAFLKFAFVLTIAIVLLWNDMEQILGLTSMSLNVAIVEAADSAAWTFLILAAALVLLPIIDVPFQLWDFGRQLRMTRQELRDEFKQTEGSPETRGRVRQMQREIARRRMMAAVPKADVIVTNPTHYSVALRYDQSKNRAPIVVAKGADLIAFQIRNIAAEHRIPVVEAPPLARALYYSTKLDKEIPAGLYLAVAKLLAYVYQLTHLRPGQKPNEVKQPEFVVPDEFVKP